MAIPPITIWYDLLQGANTQHTDRLQQSPSKGLEFATCKNLIPDPAGELRTRTGFKKVKATAISGTPTITGMYHLGDLADETFLSASDGKIARANANPPVDLVGGTDFTTGANVLTRGDIANDVLIVVSNERDAPQQITSGATKTDLAGTPAKGVDFKYFARRPCMFAPDVGGTVHRMKMVFGSTDDSNILWLNPVTLNFLNFGREGSGVNLLGGERFMDHMVGFTEDDIYPIYSTPSADAPMGFQDSILPGKMGGPVSIHSVVADDNDSLFWISRSLDVKRLRADGQVVSVGFAAQPFLRGLNQSRLKFTVGGWEPRYRMVVWAVSNGQDTAHADVMAYHPELKAFFFHTLSRNAFANRVVNGQATLIGGGLAGLFYQEYDVDSTTGNLDDSAAAIDADLISPRMHLGLPGVEKKIPFFRLEFDPISTESITVQYRLNDASAFVTADESPVVMSGTDIFSVPIKINAPFERIQVRIRDAVINDRYRVTKIGFPNPISLTSRK